MVSKSFIKNAALVSASLVFALVLGELTLRVIDFSYPSFHSHDIVTGSRLRPGAEGWYKIEGEAYIKINSSGMRDDREIAINKPSGSFRIAVLGDSYVEALQIPTNETFVRLVENKLQECNAFSGRIIEILNFGVSGHSTAQELITLRHRVWQYKPDLVLLAFLAGNDIGDNEKSISQDRLRPFFSLQGDQLVLDNSFINLSTSKLKASSIWSTLTAVSDYMRVLQLINRVKNIIGPQLSTLSLNKAASADGHQIGLNDNIYIKPTDEKWSTAWRVTEQLVLTIFNEVKDHQSRFLLVDITNGIEVHPDRDLRNKYLTRLGVPNFNYPHLRLAELSAVNKINFLGLHPFFSEYAENSNTHLHGFPKTGLGSGHWNKAGHLLAAKLISSRICADYGT